MNDIAIFFVESCFLFFWSD